MQDFEEIGDDPELGRLAEQIEKMGRDLGLYLDHVAIAQHAQAEDQLVVFANFRMGEVATRKRTIDPEGNKLDKEFRGLTDSFEQDQWETIRRQIAEGKPFGQDDPDA